MHRLLAIAALVLSFGISSAEAAKRVALVIGNDSYKTLPDLNNARTDARGMAAKLKELGWSVILRQDASRRDISRSLADFEGRLKDAEVGLVFYAGHGIQKDGANYLVPSNAQIEVEEDLHLEGVKSKEFLEVMERAGAPLNIVILDACRDNPLPKRSRSGARGLSTPVIPKGIKGTAILYSAAPGQVAQDGPRGGHGVFTGELLKVLDRPGLKLEEVFKQTATKVAAATNGSQDPWINSSVKGDFFFREGKATPTASAPAADKETVFWQSIANSQNPASFEAYLSQYPKGVFAPLARIKIAELKSKQVAVARPPEAIKSAPNAELLADLEPKSSLKQNASLFSSKQKIDVSKKEHEKLINLPPAEYVPLPLGTKVFYDSWQFEVKEQDGMETSVRDSKYKWWAYVGNHFKEGENLFTENVSSGTLGSTVDHLVELTPASRKALASFWPLNIGSEVSLEATELYRDERAGTWEDYWNFKTNVERRQKIIIAGKSLGTFLLITKGKSRIGRSFTQHQWLHAPSGIIVRQHRKWNTDHKVSGYNHMPIIGTRPGEVQKFELLSVNFPPGSKNLLAN